MRQNSHVTVNDQSRSFKYFLGIIPEGTNSKQVAIAVGATAAAVVAGTIIYQRWQKREEIPKKWRAVGEVTDLLCYPIKSCGVIHVRDFDCELLGPQKQLFRDRIFMVVESDTKKFITARKYPLLVKVTPAISGSVLTLSAPSVPEIQIDLNEILKGIKEKGNVWDAIVDVYDCGDEVGRWFSRLILKQENGLRLVYYPYSNPTRPIREKNKHFKTMTREHVGAMHDASSYMMTNEGSVDELNSRLANPVTALHFRPNIVIKGPAAYAEDEYKYVKIGNGAIFKKVKPCTRCVFTTIDPETGARDSSNEPLKTLKT